MSDLALAPIIGTGPEKLEVFKNIANTMASARLVPGYDTPGKVMTACWLADALAIHPTIFMNGVHAMEIKGRVSLTPKWEFEHALLLARLPGYYMREVELTDETCTLEFGAKGLPSIQIEYTMDRARRQGLYEKNENYAKSPREMLFKQAFHRGAKQIGAHILMGLPPAREYGEVEDDDPPATARPPEKSHAEVLDEAVVGSSGMSAGALDAPATAGSSDRSMPGDPAPPVTVVMRLGKRLRTVFALTDSDKRGMLQKAGVVMGAVLGTDPMEYERADMISNDAAEQMLAYLDARYDENGKPKKSLGDGGLGPIARAWQEQKKDDGAGANSKAAGMDAAPAPVVVPDPVPPPAKSERTVADICDGSWEGFVTVARRAEEKVPGSVFAEYPEGRGVWWLTSEAVLKRMGFTSAQKIKKDGAVVVSKTELMRFTNEIWNVFATPQWFIEFGLVAPPEKLERQENRK